MAGSFFELVSQFASSVDDEDAAKVYARLLDSEGKKEFSQELRAILAIDREE